MSDTPNGVGFGIRNLDTMFCDSDGQSAFRLGRVLALIGEEGTHKGRQGRAFLAQGIKEGGNAVLFTFGDIDKLVSRMELHWESARPRIENLGMAESREARKQWLKDVRALRKAAKSEGRLIHRRMSAQGLSAERFVHVVMTALLTSCVSYLERLLKEETNVGDVKEQVHSYYMAVKGDRQNAVADVAESVENEVGALKSWLYDSFPNRPVPWAKHVRVVIDDLSQFRAVYPDVDENRSVLGYLIDALNFVGFTALVIDTQPGSPFDIVRNDTDRELRSYVDNVLYTWTIRLGGESRIAITVIPPVADKSRNYIRELRGADSSEREALTVDRHLELYSLTDEGEPRLTPFHALLFDETGPNSTYMVEANTVVKHATGHSFSSEMDFVQYRESQWLRDMLNIRPSVISSDETVLVQVDNWWMDWEKDPIKGKVTSQLLPLPETYGKRTCLDTAGICEEFLDEDILDSPLFRRPDSDDKPQKRRSSPIKNDDAKAKRLVPYYWNFGFLMLKQQSWCRGRASDLIPTKLEHALLSIDPMRGREAEVSDTAHNLQLRLVANSRHLRGVAALLLIGSKLNDATHDPLASHAVDSEGRNRLEGRLPWSDFFGAASALCEIENAYRKQGAPAVPFRLACPSGESLNCFVLEVWSSMYDELGLTPDVPALDSLSEAAKEVVNKWRPAAGEANPEKLTASEYAKRLADLESAYQNVIVSEAKALKEEQEAKALEGEQPDGLLDLLQKHDLGTVLDSSDRASLALMHIIEVLDMRLLVDPVEPLDIDASKEPPGAAIAGRHWYASAVKASNDSDPNDPLVPFMLPGGYSTRGDWYLAAMQESRSEYMAELATQALTSRRAAIERLDRGIGLPFVDLSSKKARGENGGEDDLRGLRCAIPHAIEGRVGYVTLQELKDIAPLRGKPLQPIWRCKIASYQQQSRILRRWVVRCLSDLSQVRENRLQQWVPAGVFLEGIRSSPSLDPKTLGIETRQWGRVPMKEFDAYTLWFEPLLGHLKEDLKMAISSERTGQ
jgi:hypothetical protein